MILIWNCEREFFVLHSTVLQNVIGTFTPSFFPLMHDRNMKEVRLEVVRCESGCIHLCTVDMYWTVIFHFRNAHSREKGRRTSGP